ncbi:MAG: hypothetical protein AAFS10_12545, partial [Myxococcota bacterium]
SLQSQLDAPKGRRPFDYIVQKGSSTHWLTSQGSQLDAPKGRRPFFTVGYHYANRPHPMPARCSGG